MCAVLVVSVQGQDAVPVPWARVWLQGGAIPGNGQYGWVLGARQGFWTRTNSTSPAVVSRPAGSTSRDYFVSRGGGVYELAVPGFFLANDVPSGGPGTVWQGWWEMGPSYVYYAYSCDGYTWIWRTVGIPAIRLVGWIREGSAMPSKDVMLTIEECAGPTLITNNPIVDMGFTNRLVSLSLEGEPSGTNPVSWKYRVAGVDIWSGTVSNGLVVTNYDLRRELISGGLTASEVPYVLGGLIGVASGGAGTGVVVNVGLTLTGAFTANIDWTQGVAYARSELAGGTNWGWIDDAARSVGVGSEDRPGPPDVSGWVGAPELSVQIMPGVVMNVGAGLSDWMARAGTVVRSLLSALVLVGFGWWIGQSVHEDLRMVWTAPQGRTAGQTIMGTGTQALSALAIASVLIGVVGAFAALAWSWVLTWLGVFSGLGALVPGWLAVVLDVGPWSTIVSCLTLVPGVLAARAWIVSVGSAMVRLLTGL